MKLYSATLLSLYVLDVLVLTPAIRLEANPNVIDISVSVNVTLQCMNDESTTNDIVDISRIRILKLVDNHWITLAEMLNFDPIVHTDPSVLATGHIGTMNDTFIKVTWPTATNQTAGQYRCDVIGFKANQDVAMLKTPIIVIVQHNVTAKEVLDIVNKLKLEFHNDLEDQRKDMETKLASLTETINSLSNQLYNATQAHEDLLSLIGAMMNDLEKQLSNQLQVSMKNATDDLLEKLEEVNSTLHQLTTNGGISIVNTLSWPQGSYALLKPEAGCPSDTKEVGWTTGFIKFHTESSVLKNNHDEVSSSSHLATPVQGEEGGKNFMYQRFCMAVSQYTGDEIWPSGSYCINRMDNFCPVGFYSGYIRYDEEDEGYSGGASPIHPDRTVDVGSDVYYCCRSDGSPDTVMKLPTSSPFYLYRYGGRCQQVAGLSVVEEFMLLDTEDNVNRDSYHGAHPDGQLNNLRLQLCYYS